MTTGTTEGAEFSRRKLTARLTEELEKLGYARRPGPSGGEVCFYKCLGRVVLTMGLEFSRHYEDRFTASYFLGPTFEWAYMLPGYSARAYRRIGKLLSAEERERLLPPFFSQAGVVDAWWVGFTEASACSFIETVRLTEPRFCDDPGLIDEALANEKMRLHVAMLRAIVELVSRGSPTASEFEYQPRRFPSGVPQPYFGAAEVVLRKAKPNMVSAQYVTLLALDAWRVATLCPTVLKENIKKLEGSN